MKNWAYSRTFISYIFLMISISKKAIGLVFAGSLFLYCQQGLAQDRLRQFLLIGVEAAEEITAAYTAPARAQGSCSHGLILNAANPVPDELIVASTLTRHLPSADGVKVVAQIY